MVSRRGVIGGALAGAAVGAMPRPMAAPGVGYDSLPYLGDAGGLWAADANAGTLTKSRLADWYSSAEHMLFGRHARILERRRNSAYFRSEQMRSWSPAFRHAFVFEEERRIGREMQVLQAAQQAAQKLFVGE